jgi:DNA gyrase subunit A
MKRPDLSSTTPEIQAYILALEEELEKLKSSQKTQEEPYPTAPLEPDEPPTTMGVITATRSGIAKRTLRHVYSRQRRGGMGIFDLETSETDPPAMLCIADQDQSLLLITNLGRAFRLPVSAVPEAPLRARGKSILGKISLNDGEHLALMLPVQAQGYLAVLSKTGMLRTLRHHIFGEYMKPGTPLYDYRSFGEVASACWTPGDADLLLASIAGKAIRFSEKLVPPQGCLGIRLSDGDQAVAVTYAYPDSNILLIGADGKGTRRSMNTFAANKAPGSGGKIAFSTEHLLAALNADGIDDVFIISRLSKIIRFKAEEIPVKDGVVQGVICMSFRADEASAVTVSYRTAAINIA